MNEMNEIIKAYLLYTKANLSCLPCKADKSPLLPKSWKEQFTTEDFEGADYIGIKCGDYSGGLICMDFDNHQNDAHNNLKIFLEIPEVKEIYNKYKLPIETSQNGGYHLLFRTDTRLKNKKLASRMVNGKQDCFIEIKAQDGYFVSSPSPKYELIRNDITKIAKLNSIETAYLIDNALSMNEYFERIKTEYEGDMRPGDQFNRDVSLLEIENILIIAGWKKINEILWRRPGKKTGTSASLKNINGCYLFYVFTSNGLPLQERTAYTPFQLKTYLQFNGDFKACASTLPKPEKITTYKKEISESELDKILESNKINTDITIEKPPIILSISDVYGTTTRYKRLFTLGNFSVLTGKAKTRKTFLLILLISFLLKKKDCSYKFINEMSETKKIIWFDTEQGMYDCWNTANRIEKLSGKTNRIKVYSLREYEPIERCQIIEYALKKFGNETGLCVIDGIADLALAINDELEATRIASMLLKITKQYNLHCTVVIHQNKNDNYATGHLGSSVIKKSETIISVNRKKGTTDTEVKCEGSRGEAFEPFDFNINENGLPVLCNEQNIPLKNFYEKEEENENFECSSNEEIPF